MTGAMRFGEEDVGKEWKAVAEAMKDDKRIFGKEYQADERTRLGGPSRKGRGHRKVRKLG